jgi:hypothetical protein
MNYVKVWAHGFAQQEGRTKGREYLVSWWCSSPAKVASGEWRSRTAAMVAGTPGLQRADAVPEMVAGTPGLQRADAVPEMVARTLGPRWCSTERSLLSGLRRGERMEEIGRGRDEPRRRAKGRASYQRPQLPCVYATEGLVLETASAHSYTELDSCCSVCRATYFH